MNNREPCKTPCAEALENPKRVGRAHYVCPQCGMDISLHVAMIAIADLRSEELERLANEAQKDGLYDDNCQCSTLGPDYCKSHATHDPPRTLP